MPIHKVDAKWRFKKVWRQRRKEFESRLQNNDPPSISELLDLPPHEEFRQRCAADVLDTGEEFVHLDQYFRGYRTEGGGYVTAKRDPQTGRYLSFKGVFNSGFHEDLPDIENMLTLDEAVELSLKDEKNLVARRWPVEHNRMQTYHITARIKDGKGCLIFDFHYSDDDHNPKHCVMDALSKTIIDKHRDMCGGCPGNGGYAGPYEDRTRKCLIL